MPTSAMTALATLTLGSAQATVTFSSISTGFRDLRLVISGSTVNANTQGLMRINSDTGANYSQVEARGNGSTAASSTNADAYVWLPNANFLGSSGNLSGINIDFLDYSATDKHKSLLYRVDTSNVATTMGVARWANTAAITSFVVYLNNGNWAAGSTFTLYGVSA